LATLRQELETDLGLHEQLAAQQERRESESAKTMQLAFKRALDIAGALTLLALLAVPALIVSIVVKLDSRGPVYLRQLRVGKHGRPFGMYKFRTMVERADQMLDELKEQNEHAGPLFKIRDDPRVTRVGRWLRKTSVDELPQLMNVLKGDMSLVGPRPPLPHEVRVYTTHQLGRLGAKPGMTGLWQVSGRSTLTFREMVELDLRYIDEWSFGGDVLILLKTLPAVVSTRGAY
jgi:lipopolysaccharide/colanic/teichoic acid biosynthesis glycosyltransferase